ncbi:hypothetical protein ACSLBF_01075 [Pseudoalteromonas sp. T1lg65]
MFEQSEFKNWWSSLKQHERSALKVLGGFCLAAVTIASLLKIYSVL